MRQYRIEATAVAVGGQTTKLNIGIDILCVFFLEIDFTSVDWGTITPGFKDIVSGDLIWDDPPANAPSVRNVGNSGMGLSLRFSKLVGVNEGKEITDFDASFGKTPQTLQHIGDDPNNPIVASTDVFFDDNPARILCSNEMGKLDLSIHPPSVLPADVYTGVVHVTGYDASHVC